MLPWVMATLSANATARNETCTCLPLVFTCTHQVLCHSTSAIPQTPTRTCLFINHIHCASFIKTLQDLVVKWKVQLTNLAERP